MKKVKQALVFECKKCQHILIVPNNRMDKMVELKECPHCGEEVPVFIFIGLMDMTV